MNVIRNDFSFNFAIFGVGSSLFKKDIKKIMSKSECIRRVIR